MKRFVEPHLTHLYLPSQDEERKLLIGELDEARDKARRRSLGNVKFIGELFNVKMLTVPIMHDCVMKLLKDRNEDSMECLCMLLSTSGKNLDLKKAKVRTRAWKWPSLTICVSYQVSGLLMIYDKA